MASQFNVADLDMNRMLSYDEFKKLNEYWAVDLKQFVDQNGHDWKATFGSEDYNSDGMISQGEYDMAMRRARFDT